MTNDQRRAAAIVDAVTRLQNALADIGVEHIRAITLDGRSDAERVASFIARAYGPLMTGVATGDIRIQDIRII